MMHPGKKLKQLIKNKTIPVAGVYDCLSALLAQKAGFQALYLSGGALSVSLLGRPDIGLLSYKQVLSIAKQIASVVKLPLIVDVDTGFEGEMNIKKCVQVFEAAGVAGIQIEDQVFPKRCGHLQGKTLVSSSRMVQKLKTALKARKSRDFLILARTDARSVEGVKKAQDRALVYSQAGADIIFPEALQSASEFKAFSSKKGVGPLLANMTEFGISPALTVNKLSRLGYKLVLFPMTAFRAAAFSMETTYKKLKKQGQSSGFLKQLQPRKELYRLINYAGIVEKKKR